MGFYFVFQFIIWFYSCRFGLCLCENRNRVNGICCGARFISVFYHQVETVDWVMHKNRTSLFSLAVSYRISIKIHNNEQTIQFSVFHTYIFENGPQKEMRTHTNTCIVVLLLLSLCQPDFALQSFFSEKLEQKWENRSMLTC